MRNIPQFLEKFDIWEKSKGNKCYSRKNGYIDNPQFNSWTRKDGTIECPYCGSTFKAKSASQMFCSDKCRKLSHKSAY